MKTPQIPNLKLDNKRLAFTKEATNSSITGDKPGVIAGDIMKTPLSSRPEPNVVDWVKALDPQGKKGGKNGKKGKQGKGKHKRINPGLSQINGTSLKEPYGTNGKASDKQKGINGKSSKKHHGSNGKSSEEHHLPDGKSSKEHHAPKGKSSEEKSGANGTEKEGKQKYVWNGSEWTVEEKSGANGTVEETTSEEHLLDLLGQLLQEEYGINGTKIDGLKNLVWTGSRWAKPGEQYHTDGTSSEEQEGTNGTKQEGKHSHQSLRRPGGANGTSSEEQHGTNGTKQGGKHRHHSFRRPGGANGTSSEEQHGNNGTKKGGKHKHLGFKEPGGQNKTSDEQHVTNGTKKSGKHRRFGFKGPGGQNRTSYELKKGKEPIKQDPVEEGPECTFSKDCVKNVEKCGGKMKVRLIKFINPSGSGKIR